MITLTPNAVEHLTSLLREKKAGEKAGLRLHVEKGGCAGWQYTMRVDEPQPEDHVFKQDGVLLIVDDESFSFLDESRIDYVEDLSDSGFRVENPHAVRSCGCGTSFEPRR